MTEYSLPIEALAQVYPRARQYIEYRDLCKEEGHTWETKEIDGWGYSHKIKVCAICGKSPDLYGWS